MSTSTARARTRRGLRRRVILPILLATPVLGGILYLTAPDHSTTSPSFGDAPPRDHGAMTPHPGGGATEAGGALPYGVTVFDDGYPGVAGLDPQLLGALRAASTAATASGIEFYLTSGWRSPEYQDQLLAEAVGQYGSLEEAARWVATADTSSHVSGDAADIGPLDASLWLSEHGAEYGLCQIYANERWHYELRPDAVGSGCPLMYTDPTEDPRMR